MPYNKKIGSIGEDIARKYLIRNGYKILDKNYRTKFGEIDIIAKDGRYIVFIEVKSRKGSKFGYPREAVDSFKQNRLKNLATLYIANKNLWDSMIRFDVVEVLLGETDREKSVAIIKNAFD
ncbi:YraN family protein [Fonticella tunisiensis]|uniref:UPF0102 protein EDD71_10677 n=1 Tax=Fonticella tunisiensis TaxID=1096341 RepID=A0A4R7KTV6_9CLOT|nr:YraN family protein [Fonticella tunisiensis]TDT61593.1 putative endonuclease [Fonticella tunisiensis]